MTEEENKGEESKNEILDPHESQIENQPVVSTPNAEEAIPADQKATNGTADSEEDDANDIVEQISAEDLDLGGDKD